jgi:hypothetical protein
MTGNILLDVVTFIHVCIDALCCLYLILFNPLYDIYYAVFVLLQTIHWYILRNECFITYIEKYLIDPNYVLGSNPTYLPHSKVYYNTTTFQIKNILVLLTLAYIWYRNAYVKNKGNNVNKYIKYIKYIVPCAIGLFIYLCYFYKHPVNNQHISPLFMQ